MNNWLLIRSVLFLHPGLSPRALKNKLGLLLSMASNRHALGAFMTRMNRALEPSTLARLGGDCLGVVQWPYLSKHWHAEERLDVIASHYEVLAQQCPALRLWGREERLLLSELSTFSAGCTLVLDRPTWFMREGELVLNLFQADLRIASIAFTLGRTDDGLAMFIGALQGIHKGVDSDTSLSIYRDLTKDFQGLRPRSLVIEALRYLGAKLGVDNIYAVGDDYRHHRHPYFSANKTQDLAANYDAIWLEHGASPSPREDFFALPTELSRKPLESIAAKKRAMYRRRYELLDSTFANIDALLPSLPVPVIKIREADAVASEN